MPYAGANTKIIASGAWVQVRVKEGENDQLKVIGLCTDASYNESFNLQDANVMGYLGPISVDSQGYRCSIQIGTFVPESWTQNGYADGGETTLSDLAPKRSEVAADGKGKTFAYLEFYNKSSSTVLAGFSHAIISDTGMRVNPNSYVTSNLSFQAMERTT